MVIRHFSGGMRFGRGAITDQENIDPQSDVGTR